MIKNALYFNDDYLNAMNDVIQLLQIHCIEKSPDLSLFSMTVIFQEETSNFYCKIHCVLPLGVVTAVDGGTDVVAKVVSCEGVVSIVVPMTI